MDESRVLKSPKPTAPPSERAMSNSVSNRLLAPEVYEAARRMKGNTTQEPNPGEMVSAYARAQHMSPHSIVGGSTKAPKALVDEYGRKVSEIPEETTAAAAPPPPPPPPPRVPRVPRRRWTLSRPPASCGPSCGRKIP